MKREGRGLLSEMVPLTVSVRGDAEGDAILVPEDRERALTGGKKAFSRKHRAVTETRY